MLRAKPRQSAKQPPFAIAAFHIDGVVDSLLLALCSQLDGIEQRRTAAGKMQRWRFVDGQLIATVFGRRVGNIESHHDAGGENKHLPRQATYTEVMSMKKPAYIVCEYSECDETLVFSVRQSRVYTLSSHYLPYNFT